MPIRTPLPLLFIVLSLLIVSPVLPQAPLSRAPPGAVLRPLADGSLVYEPVEG